MAGGETAVADCVITADAPDLCIEGSKALCVVAEAAGFSCAARCVVLGIEEQHQPAALHRSGSAKVAVLILQAEGGEPVADPEGHSIEMKRLNPRQQAPCPGRENQGREETLRHA